jgi:hypothetical protein
MAITESLIEFGKNGLSFDRELRGMIEQRCEAGCRCVDFDRVRKNVAELVQHLPQVLLETVELSQIAERTTEASRLFQTMRCACEEIAGSDRLHKRSV